MKKLKITTSYTVFKTWEVEIKEDYDISNIDIIKNDFFECNLEKNTSDEEDNYFETDEDISEIILEENGIEEIIYKEHK